MIGENYWSTGINIAQRGEKWSVKLAYFDSGFCEDASSEGELRLRYLVDNLTVGINTLKADAERLGIVWTSSALGPTVYCEQDGELEAGDSPVLREIADMQAVRLGWQPIYRTAAAALEHGR